MADGMGLVCYHHQSKPAVAQCADCGKGICKDCYDSYGAGMGAGKALCFDCTEGMVQEHTADIAAFKKSVENERKLMIAGVIIGAIVGIIYNSKQYYGGDVSVAILMAIVFAIFGAGMGASFGFLVKWAFTLCFSVLGIGIGLGLFFLLIMLVLFGGIFLGIPISLIRYFYKKKQIRQAEEILATDAQILQELRDYFAYTQAMENNTGVDLAQLAEQGSELFDNTYARAILDKGEKEAQAELRQGMVTIAANGEIIRKFDKKPKDKKSKDEAA